MAMIQIDMFGGPPVPEPPLKPKRTQAAKPNTHEERWDEFSAAHPEVYAEIRRLALKDLADKFDRTSIGYLVEQARRNLRTTAKDDQGYMINNSARAIIVRRLIAEVPALAALFETRERRSA